MTESKNNLFLIHYHEIGLKGKNRGRFEAQLLRNIETAFKDLPPGKITRISGRILLELTSDVQPSIVKRRLSEIFGIANFSEAIQVPSNIETIRNTVWTLAQKVCFKTFKIVTRRADKSFPLTSEEINRDVGAYVQVRSQAQVRMDNPDLTCFVELSLQDTFIYTEKFSGPGGLPVGTNERAISLLSSGIDSPVASYKIMKRGVNLTFVHFHSQPYTDRNSQRNTEALVQILTHYQYRSSLYLVPFVKIQRHIMTGAPASFRIILYRRTMLRIAEKIAKIEGAQALVTGDNVGQVASQTLTNLRTIEEVTLLPVLRPLAGDNKEEIIVEAKQIGTYETSIEPFEDCCSVFIPKHPETKANLESVRKIESQLEFDSLIEQTFHDIEVKVFKS